MNLLARIWATFLIALRRLLAQRWLALATALGLVAAIAMIMSIPLYSDAVYFRVLQEELQKADQAAKGVQADKRDPRAFTFLFRYFGSLYGLKQWEEIEAVDAYLSEPAAAQLGLPVRRIVRYLRTDNFRLFPAGASRGVWRRAGSVGMGELRGAGRLHRPRSVDGRGRPSTGFG